jgi:hypothetical protein
VGFGLSVAPQNRRRDVDVGHTSRSSNLLHVKASLAMVFQSDLKTDRGVTTLSRRFCRRQVEDGRVDATGCIGPCYPTFTVFNVLGYRG